MLRITSRVAVALLALMWSLPSEAGCVNLNGNSVSGKKEAHKIGPNRTDKERFVRLTLGEVTVQVDSQGSKNWRGRSCNRRTTSCRSVCIGPRMARRPPVSIRACGAPEHS